ncbi:MAG: TetR/AcrR family transcriptional regulator [Aeromicrobium sp.]
MTAEPLAARLPAEERREQILRCAMKLFEERPHTSVSTAEIAAAAGVVRPLIHHYFGTRRDLYIEVLRRLYFIPPVDPTELDGETVADRAGQLLDRWLDGIARRPNTWLAFTAGGGPGADPAVAEVVHEADELIANRLIDALDVAHRRADLLPAVVAWSGLVKGSVHQWLTEGTMTRAKVREIVLATLLTVLEVA